MPDGQGMKLKPLVLNEASICGLQPWLDALVHPVTAPHTSGVTLESDTMALVSVTVQHIFEFHHGSIQIMGSYEGERLGVAHVRRKAARDRVPHLRPL